MNNLHVCWKSIIQSPQLYFLSALKFADISELHWRNSVSCYVFASILHYAREHLQIWEANHLY